MCNFPKHPRVRLLVWLVGWLVGWQVGSCVCHVGSSVCHKKGRKLHFHAPIVALVLFRKQSKRYMYICVEHYQPNFVDDDRFYRI